MNNLFKGVKKSFTGNHRENYHTQNKSSIFDPVDGKVKVLSRKLIIYFIESEAMERKNS
jgi:hypothetical protein